MAVGGADPAVRLSTRPYRASDRAAVLALVADDRLTGQPEATPAMLAEAIGGRSPVDAERWAELDTPHTEVVCDETGQVLGAVSCATRRTDQAGLILWLHAGEDLAVTRALVELALSRLGGRTVHAFELPIALSLGMRGLPVRSRPVTRRALGEAGFSVGRQWRYLHRMLPHRGDAGEVRTYPIAEVTATSRPTGRRLLLREPDGAPVGEAVVGEPVDGIGVLWWIAIDPEHRARGLGANLAEQCCSVLAANGAHEVIAYLDEDAPASGRQCDTVAASHLLGARGFREMGRLSSFSRRP
ncbi:hypothetical protein TR51_10525 [Kitasatospora griseola]|uniref:N-acetyltransferase domain-containing protein n=1 Tax=Kitasatospora griseola TaxID=2064 RepID=A0A0D0PWC5_KITGR|nr:GNAT family N-acetyltransferase [Kitasatospora griseola]KIQ64652.1 hypothetical protein TR51_10525 [Kitasatospora griseola]